ncbi:MAG: hypothetical protein ONB11_03925 [candidate division KSB1 bacterium]|nr:hypothetical protein [candidate division KSB1 bacterium]
MIGAAKPHLKDAQKLKPIDISSENGNDEPSNNRCPNLCCRKALLLYWKVECRDIKIIFNPCTTSNANERSTPTAVDFTLALTKFLISLRWAISNVFPTIPIYGMVIAELS